MIFSSCLTDQDPVIVLDASVVINLLATAHTEAILQALGTDLIVVGNVVREIDQGEGNGRPESKQLDELIDKKFLRTADLFGPTLTHFFDMVSGPTSDTLGDGEAATLAYAYDNRFVAAIDEKKATRIATERFQSLKLVTTIDILAYEPVRAKLGRSALAEATLRALTLTRMQVRENQFEWISQLIGEGNVATCASLKRLARCRPDQRNFMTST